MEAVVKSRPDEIVHCGIHDDEVLLTGLLDVLDPSDQGARVTTHEPTRFEEDL